MQNKKILRNVVIQHDRCPFQKDIIMGPRWSCGLRRRTLDRPLPDMPVRKSGARTNQEGKLSENRRNRMEGKVR